MFEKYIDTAAPITLPEAVREKRKLMRRIKGLLAIFIAGLIFSGVTAFPLESELAVAHEWLQSFRPGAALSEWIEVVYEGVKETNSRYPFISYGTDWLAFAHLVLAICFIGPFVDPVKNIWVVQFGIIACAAILPLALIAGEARGIPVFWRLIDTMFGIIGGCILIPCYICIKKLEKIN